MTTKYFARTRRDAR